MPDGKIFTTLLDLKEGQGKLTGKVDGICRDVGALKEDVSDLKNGRVELVTKDSCEKGQHELADTITSTIHNSVQAALRVREHCEVEQGQGEATQELSPLKIWDTRLGLLLKVLAIVATLGAGIGAIFTFYGEARDLRAAVKSMKSDHDKEHVRATKFLDRLKENGKPVMVPYPYPMPGPVTEKKRHAPNRRVAPARRRARPRRKSP